MKRPLFKNHPLLIITAVSLSLALFLVTDALADAIAGSDTVLQKGFLLAAANSIPRIEPPPSSESQEKEVPEWIRRTNIAIEAGSDIKPKFFMETIQPLFGTQEKDLVFFNQSRISARDDRSIFNVGFGLRKIFDDNLLLGINAFYDYQSLHQHGRAGMGFEAITERGFEMRTNTYIRVSNERLVSDDGFNFYYEKVANGLDWEFGTPLPYLSFLKAYGGGYWYDFEHFKNKYGWQLRLEYSPIKYSRLDFIMRNDNKTNDIEYRFEGALTLAFTSFCPRDIIKDIRVSREAFPKINLRDKVLDRVVRDFDITVISKKKAKSDGLTIEGGKSG